MTTAGKRLTYETRTSSTLMPMSPSEKWDMHNVMNEKGRCANSGPLFNSTLTVNPGAIHGSRCD